LPKQNEVMLDGTSASDSSLKLDGIHVLPAQERYISQTAPAGLLRTPTPNQNQPSKESPCGQDGRKLSAEAKEGAATEHGRGKPVLASGDSNYSSSQDTWTLHVASPGSDESSQDVGVYCWTSSLRLLTDAQMGCTPGFVPGKGHLKNKFCWNRRGGMDVPVQYIRALPPSLKTTFVNISSEGFWSRCTLLKTLVGTYSTSWKRFF
jgi:hypothetical protein